MEGAGGANAKEKLGGVGVSLVRRNLQGVGTRRVRRGRGTHPQEDAHHWQVVPRRGVHEQILAAGSHHGQQGHEGDQEHGAPAA